MHHYVTSSRSISKDPKIIQKKIAKQTFPQFLPHFSTPFNHIFYHLIRCGTESRSPAPLDTSILAPVSRVIAWRWWGWLMCKKPGDSLIGSWFDPFSKANCRTSIQKNIPKNIPKTQFGTAENWSQQNWAVTSYGFLKPCNPSPMKAPWLIHHLCRWSCLVGGSWEKTEAFDSAKSEQKVLCEMSDVWPAGVLVSLKLLKLQSHVKAHEWVCW